MSQTLYLASALYQCSGGHERAAIGPEVWNQIPEEAKIEYDLFLTRKSAMSGDFHRTILAMAKAGMAISTIANVCAEQRTAR